MKNWCKVIPLEDYDVLVERISNEQDKEAIRVSVRMHGMHLMAIMGFEEDGEKADKAFDKYDEAGAGEFIAGMQGMMSDQA